MSHPRPWRGRPICVSVGACGSGQCASVPRTGRAEPRGRCAAETLGVAWRGVARLGLAGFGRGARRLSLSAETESRDGKQKEAAAAFVVAEECGNVEAPCQTCCKRGQVAFSRRGKATTRTTTKATGRGVVESSGLRTRSGWVDGWSSGFLPAGAHRPGSRGSRRAGREVQLPAGVGRPRCFLRGASHRLGWAGPRRGWGWGCGGRRRGGLRCGRRLLGCYLCGPRPGSRHPHPSPRHAQGARSWASPAFAFTF